MQIRKLAISKFRGIDAFDWVVPDNSLVCLIGKGDSGKSTILDAIRLLFHPNWNVTICDSDFHNGDTSTPIVINAEVGKLSKDFLNFDKYASLLRGWSTTKKCVIDEPDDDCELILSAKLVIENDLEPIWKLYSDRLPDGIDFRSSDRSKIGANVIGNYSEKQFAWGKGTVLSKMTDEVDIGSALADVARVARKSLESEHRPSLLGLDAAAKKTETLAREFGILVQTGYKASLDYQTLNLSSGGLSIHDGEIPLRQFGLGSKRMLLCGIQDQYLENGHITLIDEIESGLEPHRISRLLNKIKRSKSGQYFITTHSPTVLRELSTKNLALVKTNMSSTQALHLGDEKYAALNLQGVIRANAESLLANRIIVCEGATEVGFLRGLGKYAIESLNDAFEFSGVAYLNAGGASKIMEATKILRTLNYDVAVVADSDAPKQFSKENALELEGLGVKVFFWTGDVCIERRAMFDLPWEGVIKSVAFADNYLRMPVIDHVKSQFKCGAISSNYNSWEDSAELRKAIGDAATSSEWFKRIANGEEWFSVIQEHLSFREPKAEFEKTIAGIFNWVCNEC